MKNKSIIYLFVAGIVLILLGLILSFISNPSSDGSDGSDKSNKTSDDISISAQNIVDNEYVKVDLISFKKQRSNYVLEYEITNKSSLKLEVLLSIDTINDTKISLTNSNFDIDASKTSAGIITIKGSVLKDAKIDTIKDIGFNVQVFDNGTSLKEDLINIK